MKVLKLALIGTAALAAASVTARADSLSDLKAQIEALNGRISQLEAAPAVPAGYQLMSVSKADAIVVPSLDIDNGFKQTNVATIGILPTADVPASTKIQWSGYARAALNYSSNKNKLIPAGAPTVGIVGGVPAVIPGTAAGSESLKRTDVFARGQLKVVGTTDTAVGEVGAQIQLRGNFHGIVVGDASVIMNEAWGWWKMTPELTLGGGYTGSLSGIGYGYDGACNCYYTDNARAGYGQGDTTQMRLSYASGPMSAAIAIEDDHHKVTLKSALGMAGEVKYSGDMFSGEISGGVWSKNSGVGAVGAWQIAAGAGFSLGDMAKISLAAGTGKYHDGVKWNTASVLMSANLSDAIHGEVAFNYDAAKGNGNQKAILAGLYYDPVSQLTIGIEGEYIKDKASYAAYFGEYRKSTSVDLVTVFRF
jgi:hypothetical protein